MHLLMSSFLRWDFRSSLQREGFFFFAWLRQMIPEYYTLAHPNAQIDNAIFWRDGNGIMECGLIESQSQLPRCFTLGGSVVC